MKQITFNELLARMPEVIAQLQRQAANAAYLVWCENLQMDSHAFGRSSVLAVGPGKTYATLEALEGKWLNDLPSERQYPTEYVDTSAVEYWTVEQGIEKEGEVEWVSWVTYPDSKRAEAERERQNNITSAHYYWRVQPLTVKEYAAKHI